MRRAGSQKATVQNKESHSQTDVTVTTNESVHPGCSNSQSEVSSEERHSGSLSAEEADVGNPSIASPLADCVPSETEPDTSDIEPQDGLGRSYSDEIENEDDLASQDERASQCSDITNHSAELHTSCEESSEASTDEDDSECPDYHDVDSEFENPFQGQDRTCDSGVTTGEALALIILFVLRHNLSEVALKDLLILVNSLFGKCVVPTTIHLFHSAVKFTKNFKTFYYCIACCNFLSVTKKTGICSVCNRSFQTSDRDNVAMFLSMSLKSQLRGLLENMTNFDFLAERYSRRPGTLSDIYDGQCYKHLVKDFSCLGNPLNISLTMNVDGCPVFKSKHCSISPIQLIINELPVFERFRNILGGIWFGKGEPNMEIYLKSFVQQCKRLADKGFRWMKDGVQVVSRAFVICCTVDSAARPLLQNMIKFNGFYGCSWCLHPGCTVNGEVRYTVATQVYEERTAETAVRSMTHAARQKVICFGYKGPSVLLNLPAFNVVHSFVPDYLHSVLLGVTRTMMKLWFEGKNSNECFYIGTPSLVSLIDSRMQKIRPPATIGRCPRGVSERELWKGQEYRSWLLYYSLPVLNGILPRSYLLHLALLVQAVFFLLQESLFGTDLNTAEELLNEFVVKYNMLYGDYSMVYNVHLLLHLAKGVSQWGPLWTHSTFVFESYNGTLLKFIKGNRGVAEQVLQKAALKQSLFSYAQTKGSRVLKAYISALTAEKRSTCAMQVSGVTLLGKGRASRCTPDERTFLRTALGRSPEQLTFFSRIIVNRKVYHCTGYTLAKRTDDCVVILNDGTYARIRLIFVYRENGHQETAMLVQEFLLFQIQFCGLRSMRKGVFSG
ncbi:uncharacterized protein LOC135384573 [Ornithodoros turicata]|uniref:uncharacterized protein LOC135384573 n=1 Tax=Ornithodoros turicata TaxID=34597 RepID=UPI003138C18A